jgi:hypothetical protein
VTQGEDEAWLYFQPRFVSASANDRIDVITTLGVEIAPADGEPAAFGWDEQGTWAFDHDTRSLTWDWVADPGPLVVSPANPQMPTGLFFAPSGWLWAAGDYTITVTATAEASDDTLTATGIFTITEEELQQLESGRGSIFLSLPLAPDDT